MISNEEAKAVNTTVIAASDFAGFIARLFDNSVVANSFGLLADRLQFYRWERAELLFKKTQEKLHQRGIKELRTVPPKILLPLIENATLEEDDDLHTLWANLLVTALTPQKQEVHALYINILRQLSGSQAKLLSELSKKYQSINESVRIEVIDESSVRRRRLLKFSKSSSMPVPVSATDVIVLCSLGVVEKLHEPELRGLGHAPEDYTVALHVWYQLSQLGREFLASVEDKNT
jgi:hypothetical protein